MNRQKPTNSCNLAIGLLFLLILANSLSTYTHASTGNILYYSATELEIESIANTPLADNKVRLELLNQYKNQVLDRNYADTAYYLTYQCFLAASIEQQTDAETLSEDNNDFLAVDKNLLSFTSNQLSTEDSINELNALITISNRNSTVLAANALCESNIAWFRGDRENYRILLEKAYQYSQSAESAILRYWISIAFASDAQEVSRHTEAAEAAQIALEIAVNNLDKPREITSRTVLSMSESELGFNEDALRNNQMAIDWEKQQNGKSYQFQTLLMNRGYILIGFNQLEEAKNYYTQAIELAKMRADEYSVNSMYTNLAAIARKQDDFELAVKLCNRVIEYSNTNNTPFIAAHAHSILASSLASLGLFESAKDSLKIAEEFFRKEEQLNALARMLEDWSILMAEQKNYKLAYNAQKSFKEIDDKIFQTIREERLFRLKAVFESKEKDNLIQQLSAQNKFQQTSLENKSLSTLVWWLTIVVLTLISILFLLVYRRLSQRNRDLAVRNEALDLQRYVDPLTGCFNRRYMEDIVNRKLLLQKKSDVGTFTFIALDIDHFKTINDTYGHAAGDAILKQFCERLTHALRSGDHLIRMGGEEFLLLVSTNSIEQSKILAEKILLLVSENPMNHEAQSIPVTVSIGVVRSEADSKIKLEDYLSLADQCMYRAKGKGRNRAICLDAESLRNFKFNRTTSRDNLVEIVPK